MMRRRWLGRLCLGLALLLALGGCSLDARQFEDWNDEPTTGGTAVVAAEDLTIGFHASQTLNPFRSSSALNQQIGKLCWEPLFALDDEMLTYGLLASGVEKVSDLEYRIMLNENRVFWDGSSVTAADVVYSYGLALDGGLYAGLSDKIVSFLPGDGFVSVTLAYANVFFINALTFPIVKQGRNAFSTVGTVEKVPYVGTGLYVPTFDDAVTLHLNPWHPRYETAAVKTITLSNTPDFSTMNDSISADILQGGYSELSGDLLPSVSGNVYGVLQNRMVYLGFSSLGACGSNALRTAISCALDRTMVASYYGGYAVTATTPFHPANQRVTVTCSNLTTDETAAAKIVQTLGAVGTLTLAVNSENATRVSLAAELARELATVGLTVKIVKLAYADYLIAVDAGTYDMYLGEQRLSCDFSFTELLRSTGYLRGYQCSAELEYAKNRFLATGDSENFLTLFNNELPFIPLVFRKGVVAYSSNLTITQSDSFDYAFCNVELTQRLTAVSQ